MKTWQPIETNQDCDDCGNSMEVLTDAEPGSCYDSDSVRCVECGLTGWISVYEDGDTLIHFEGE